MAKQRLNIVGFIHVCMINDWEKILSEQIFIMRESGLYEYMRVANICALGTEEELCKLQDFIIANPKLRLGLHSERLEDFEFITLGYLKVVMDRSSDDIYGFYVHSKGVSWPQGTRGYEGGKHWRDYMNHFTLTRWEQAVEMLEIGYDLCGVKLINRGWPLHYSGNFFWYKSGYIKRLLPVRMMNLKDRFNAEMWVCSGQPIAATLCQKFVDYNTKGIFNPEDYEYKPLFHSGL